MPCKIYLRHDQSVSQQKTCQSKEIFVYAPSWVRQGLDTLAKHLKNVEFEVHEKPSFKRGRNANEPTTPKALESIKITETFNSGDLVILQKIARNESRNTNGVINTSYYSPEVKDHKLIYSIKDLSRLTVIVGEDLTTFCGGYKSSRVVQKDRVYICDLAALQFQKAYNSGRLILIQEAEPNKGHIDDFIFENVVGEKKRSFKDIVSSSSEESKKRYLKHDGYGKKGKGSCFLDTHAYKKFVEQDVVLTGLALADRASSQGHQLNFKFLKYGTGYFAWKFVKELDSLILSGVIDGLEALFGRGDEHVLKTIKHLEFPFYKSDLESTKRLNELKKKYKVDYRFSRDDALKRTAIGRGLITATTNCADSNVACGKY